MTDTFHHVPIMLNEVVEFLSPQRGGVFVDGTLGIGGHANAVLERLPDTARLIGIDRDPAALKAATERLERFGQKFQPVKGNFFDMKALVNGLGITSVNGILLDLGVSSYQLDTPQRGFSYKEEAPLDMRMDTTAALSAYNVVNEYPFEELARVIREYGEERFSSRIASNIVKRREESPINTTTELAELVKRSIPAATRREGPHPARRTFQALRIEVNGELDGLRDAIQNAHDLLAPGGRLAIITFHSLEDRIVKQAFKDFIDPCICDRRAPVCVCGRKPTARLINRKPLVAGEDELNSNPRAHSAKLRAIEKL